MSFHEEMAQRQDPLPRAKFMDEEKQSINISSNLKRGYNQNLKKIFSNIGLKMG